MKILIDIPEEAYNRLLTEQHLPNRLDIEWCIVHGTPIPDNASVCDIEQIRAEIERLHYHPKLDFIKNDEVVDMTLEIIDKYREESEDR